ncbi:MAG: AAA family ATPase [Candidatus Woesearchaeota archaeon]|jgi:predicted kinase
MKLVLLNGSSCAGKSSTIKALMKERKQLFLLSYDSIKWFFSHYQADKHQEDVQRVFLAVANSVFKMKYDIVCDSNITKIHRSELVNMALSQGYKILEVNLEADYDVLSKRFDARVANALADPNSKISNISKERFKELYDLFHKEKNPDAHTFKSDKLTPEEIAKEILRLI